MVGEGEREGESKGREVGSDDAKQAESRQRASVEEGRVEEGRADEGNERGRDGRGMGSGREEASRGGIERGMEGEPGRYPEEDTDQYRVNVPVFGQLVRLSDKSV